VKEIALGTFKDHLLNKESTLQSKFDQNTDDNELSYHEKTSVNGCVPRDGAYSVVYYVLRD
jgi:hypothetical protein